MRVLFWQVGAGPSGMLGKLFWVAPHVFTVWSTHIMLSKEKLL